MWVLGVPEGADSPKEHILFSTEKEARMVRAWREVSSELKFVRTEAMLFNVLKIGKYKKKKKGKKDSDERSDGGDECSVGMICLSPSSPETHIWVVSQDLALPCPQEHHQQQNVSLWHHGPFQPQPVYSFHAQCPQSFFVSQQQQLSQQVMPVPDAQGYQAIYLPQEPFLYLSF